MSETTSPLDGENDVDFGQVAECDHNASVLDQCSEMLRLIATINSADGPYNIAEARQMSEEETEAARRHQCKIIRRIKDLSLHVTEKAALTNVEIDAKVRVLDALTSIASWERESLRALRVSIDRDQEVIKRGLAGLPPLRAPRQTWLSRFNLF
jgi:hypothetical protein